MLNKKYKTGNRRYDKPQTRRFILLLFFIASAPTVFSQEVDSAVNISDTAQLVSPGEEDDSAEQTKYNYYINLGEWKNDSLAIRQVPDSSIQSLKAQDDFWYADKEFKKKQEQEFKTGNFLDWLSRQRWYKVLAWIIVTGGFTAVLIWYLAVSNVGIFSRRSKKLTDPVTGESSENIFEINYQREIDHAVQAGNYRLATRLLFLRLLKNLAEKNIIQYKQGRTNFDYLLQLHNTAYYKDFFRLTRNYEYAWYGQFDVKSDTFAVIKNEFDNFTNRIG